MEEHIYFGEALERLVTTEVKGIRIPSWGQDVVVRVQFPNDKSKMTAPYLYVESRFGKVPWTPNQIELLTAEWELI